MILQHKSQNGFVSLIFMILTFVGIFYIIKGFYWLLWWIGPLLLVYSYFFIDKKVLHDYIKMLFKTLRSNPILGIIYIIGTVIGFPFVSGFLFVKAYLKNKIKKMGVDMDNPFQQQGSFLGEETIEDFTEYEIIDEEIQTPNKNEFL